MRWIDQGLSAQELAVLVTVWLQPDLTLSQCEKLAKVTRSTAVKSLRILAEKNLITKVGRSQYQCLSVPNGTELVHITGAPDRPDSAPNGLFSVSNIPVSGSSRLAPALTPAPPDHLYDDHSVKVRKRTRKVKETINWSSMVEAYNDLVEKHPNMAMAAGFPAKQQASYRKRQEDYRQYPDLWAQILRGVQCSEFLQGRKPPLPGYDEPYTCRLAYLVTPRGCSSAVEAALTGEPTAAAPMTKKEFEALNG